jgi:hypothetical protein
VLLDWLGKELDTQVQALAVTCMGHVGRMHGAIGSKVVTKLRELLEDSELAAGRGRTWRYCDIMDFVDGVDP